MIGIPNVNLEARATTDSQISSPHVDWLMRLRGRKFQQDKVIELTVESRPISYSFLGRFVGGDNRDSFRFVHFSKSTLEVRALPESLV